MGNFIKQYEKLCKINRITLKSRFLIPVLMLFSESIELKMLGFGFSHNLAHFNSIFTVNLSEIDYFSITERQTQMFV